jgi:hypothetical protein
MFDVLDPTHELGSPDARLAPRPRALSGITVGLLSNGKAGVARFFDHVEAILRDEWGVADVVRRTKGNYSAPAETELMAEAAGWQVLFAGVGD